MLIGGDKTGDDRWYVRMVPLAENIYAEYLRELAQAEDGKRKKHGEEFQ